MFTKGGTRIQTTLAGNVALDDENSYVAAAEAGLGIARIPAFVLGTRWSARHPSSCWGTGSLSRRRSTWCIRRTGTSRSKIRVSSTGSPGCWANTMAFGSARRCAGASIERCHRSTRAVAAVRSKRGNADEEAIRDAGAGTAARPGPADPDRSAQEATGRRQRPARHAEERRPQARAQAKKLVFDFWRIVYEGAHVDEAPKYMAEGYIQHNPNVVSGRAAFVELFKKQRKPATVGPLMRMPVIPSSPERTSCWSARCARCAIGMNRGSHLLHHLVRCVPHRRAGPDRRALGSVGDLGRWQAAGSGILLGDLSDSAS